MKSRISSLQHEICFPSLQGARLSQSCALRFSKGHATCDGPHRTSNRITLSLPTLNFKVSQQSFNERPNKIRNDPNMTDLVSSSKALLRSQRHSFHPDQNQRDRRKSYRTNPTSCGFHPASLRRTDGSENSGSELFKKISATSVTSNVAANLPSSATACKAHTAP